MTVFDNKVGPAVLTMGGPWTVLRGTPGRGKGGASPELASTNGGDAVLIFSPAAVSLYRPF